MKNFYKQFKNPIILIILLFAGFFIYTKLAGPIPFFINSVNTTKTDLFTAQGQGEISGVPDTASLSLGVTENSLNIADAKDKVNLKVNKIITDLKNLGISEKDIKTTNYSLNPNYGANEIVPMMYPSRGGATITSYTVTQNIEVKIKQTDKINKTIDIITKDGANLVNGVNFTFSDEQLDKLQNQARKEAVTIAKKKAQDLTNAAGIKLGRIVNVVESSNNPRFMPMMAGIAEKTDTEQPTNITPGENTVTVDITIYYEIY